MTVLLMSTLAHSQANDPGLTVKPTPAAQALVEAARNAETEQKTVDTGFKQAKATLDTSQKQLQDALKTKSTELQEKLKADKKYKPLLDEIETIQKQLATSNQDAQNKFNQTVGPVQQKLSTDRMLVNTLEPIVAKENEFPPTVKFDAATQTWKDTKAAEPAKK